ncbi:Non-structural maintenance of chromosomes element 4 A [Parelaphostrongylus tenuis]|uniref:Non-structural maintenance of chromosomes element 4 n=1 Tax=Parelaphostrongylus tenuis TaxID=148309 RepID=A0AAD5QNY9_PARTN|nr:Non-structural maintenance of chromosomes element 4 A [Parelaphostrongylus tenuis]
MPRPLANSNSSHQTGDQDGGNAVEESGLTRKQIIEAELLNSIVDKADPSEYFARRASLREAYQGICNQLEEKCEVDKGGNSLLIDDLQKSLNDVERSYQDIGAGGKELAADAETLVSIAKTLSVQVNMLHNANAERVVTPENFANALILWMNSQPQCAQHTPSVCNPLLIDETEVDSEDPPSGMSQVKNSLDESESVSAPPKISFDQWRWFGRQNYGTLTYDVSINNVSLQTKVPNDQVVASSEVVNKERAKRQKDVKEEAVVLKDKHLESVDDEVSVARELDKVRKALKKAWKDDSSIDYFKFVMDPTDFGMTVQNMFYISFLIKDGHVRLSMSDEQLPVLLPVSDEERQNLQVDNRSAAATNQAIISLSYEDWEEMARAMNS